MTYRLKDPYYDELLEKDLKMEFLDTHGFKFLLTRHQWGKIFEFVAHAEGSLLAQDFHAVRAEAVGKKDPHYQFHVDMGKHCDKSCDAMQLSAIAYMMMFDYDNRKSDDCDKANS